MRVGDGQNVGTIGRLQEAGEARSGEVEADPIIPWAPKIDRARAPQETPSDPAVRAAITGAAHGARPIRGAPLELVGAIAPPPEVEALARAFSESGRTLYAVGGAVRDALLGRKIKDWDLATDAPPSEVREILARAGVKSRATAEAEALGVITAEGAKSFEIATFRKDSAGGDGRRPVSVSFASIAEDAERRDLTVNALYYDIAAKQIFDFTGGLDDIRDRRARMIGDPDRRFSEDGLRVMRFLRFHAMLDQTSDLEPEVERAIRAHAKMPGVAATRLREELISGLRNAMSPASYLRIAARTEVLSRLLGEDVALPAVMPEARSLPAVLALILRANDDTKVTIALAKLEVTREESQAVLFLRKFTALSADNAFELRRAQKHARVSDDQLASFARDAGLDPELTAAYLAYTPSVRGDDPRFAKLEGKARGEAIAAEERRRFEAHLRGKN